MGILYYFFRIYTFVYLEEFFKTIPSKKKKKNPVDYGVTSGWEKLQKKNLKAK